MANPEAPTAPGRQRTVTILTLVIVGVWIISAVVRIFIPWPAAGVLDGVLPLVVGYWFLTSATTKKEETA